MSRKAPSLAERLRAQREAFELGLQWGCTPAEAIERKKLEQAKARDRAATARLRAKMAGRHPTPPQTPKSPPAPALRGWWHD